MYFPQLRQCRQHDSSVKRRISQAYVSECQPVLRCVCASKNIKICFHHRRIPSSSTTTSTQFPMDYSNWTMPFCQDFTGATTVIQESPARQAPVVPDPAPIAQEVPKRKRKPMNVAIKSASRIRDATTTEDEEDSTVLAPQPGRQSPTSEEGQSTTKNLPKSSFKPKFWWLCHP